MSTNAYAEELRWLYGLSARGIRLELDRMRGGLAHRGHPERGLNVVHVAGTNGKGSTSSFVERMLRAAGYRTGIFTSPHLHRFVERFKVNGRPLSESEVTRRLADQRHDAANMPPLTFFEHSALLAFEAFRDHGCEVVVLEVGLGGRLDATNVIDDPAVSVITRIAFDHVNILGDTLGVIAKEKAGILKKGRPAVIGAREPEARRVLLDLARRKKTNAWAIGREFDGTPSARGARIRIGDTERDFRLGLAGAYQAENAALAVAAVHRLRDEGWSIDDDAIAKGLAKTTWPGRLELRRPPASDAGPRPRFLFDCAHNPDGCVALAEHLRTMARPSGRVVLLFGALADKEHEPMLASFDGLVDRRVYAIPKMPRAPESAKVFTALRPGAVARSVHEGVAKAEKLAGPDGLVIVGGSIFLVQEARAHVLGLRTDPSVGM
ncbi:MAG: bifunctional folylpolyglutamate synthase/dihydrofolate synthase [Sandaracinus sp.]|nr:bifunctional folylpolyglutamate synthase/dihydrofolate synthase [Sandaracinus sp.]MCB9633090.1 bifunctional folylpolyglutamate synthase/dihydrofolate synthase [Sandaracinus sp.]